MKLFVLSLAVTLLSLIPMAQAKVVKGHDSQNNCTRYRVVDKRTIDGEYLFPMDELKEGESIFYGKKEQYGLSFKIHSIDFENHRVYVKVNMNNIGFNKLLDGKVYYLDLSDVSSPKKKAERNMMFRTFNERTYTINSLCVKDNSEIAYIAE